MPREPKLSDLESGTYTVGATTLGVVPEFLREEPLERPKPSTPRQLLRRAVERQQRALQDYQVQRALGGGALPPDVGSYPLRAPEWIQSDQPTRYMNDAYPGVWFKQQL